MAGFVQRAEHALFTVPCPRPFDEQIMRGPRQIGSRMLDLSVSSAAENSHEGLLHEVGCRLATDLPSEIVEQSHLLGAIEGREGGGRTGREWTTFPFGGFGVEAAPDARGGQHCSAIAARHSASARTR